MPKTLDELREENQQAEQVEQETEQLDESPEVDEVESDVQEADETQTNEETSEEAEEVLSQPAWMDTGESEEQEDSVNEVAAKVRRKWKGKFEEASQETESLRGEVEALKAQLAGTNAQAPVKPRPKLEDFGYDDAKFQEANDEWLLEQAEARVLAREKQSNLKAQQQAQQARLKQSLESHYNEADSLVNSGQVSAEKYENAEEVVRKSIANLNGHNEETVDQMIDAIGQGSAKVLYHLGVNPSKRNEFITLLQNEPVKATFWLGKLSAKLDAPTKKISNAPKPSQKLKGSGTSSAESALRSKYRNAKTPQERFKLSQEGGSKGFNTIDW